MFEIVWSEEDIIEVSPENSLSTEWLEDESGEIQGDDFQEKCKKKPKKCSKKEKEFEIKSMICQKVCQYPAIYQITHADYSNKTAKDAMWEEISRSISDQLGNTVTVPNCRKYWDSLRESTRVYLDKAKVGKICDKSGAPADLLELYNCDGQNKVDLYQDRWPFAELMSFYIPSCARTAYTVSLGNSASNTRLKHKIETGREADLEDIELSQENDLYFQQETSFTSTDQNSMISPSTCKPSKSSRKGDNDTLDSTLITLASSVSNFMNSRTSQKEYKYKEFHTELDNVLCQLPSIQAMKLNIAILEMAYERLKICKSLHDDLSI